MGGTRRRQGSVLALAVAVATVGLPLLGPSGPSAAAATLPPGFVDEAVVSGFSAPMAVRFSPDGRVFVAEKSGIVKVFDSLSDPTPTVFANLQTNVYNAFDRGLLGLALHPDFPATPYVYVSYTFDAPIGGTAPRWGSPGVASDPCPTPPGPNTDGCVVSGRVSRLTAAGDGASYTFVDYGQAGNPVNPCGDPGGAAPSPPTAEGGSLRAQDIRTPGDPVGLNGSILRIDPVTGAGLADNPLGSSPDANARRIVTTGLRNPFRIAIRPGTNEVWIGDVGYGRWEEIDVVAAPTDGTIDNFGWPCYEGAGDSPHGTPQTCRSANSSTRNRARWRIPTWRIATPTRSSRAKPARPGALRFRGWPSRR